MYAATNYKPTISVEEKAIEESIIEKALVEVASGKVLYFDQIQKLYHDTKLLQRNLSDGLSVKEQMDKFLWLKEVSRFFRAFV